MIDEGKIQLRWDRVGGFFKIEMTLRYLIGRHSNDVVFGARVLGRLAPARAKLDAFGDDR